MLLFQQFVSRIRCSDRAGSVVTAIKVGSNTRWIHFGGKRSPESILFGVKWTRLMSKQKQTVLVDDGRHREEACRKAPNDSYWFDMSVLCTALCSHPLHAESKGSRGSHAEVYCYYKWITFRLFKKKTDVKICAKGHGRDLFRCDKASVFCPWHLDFFKVTVMFKWRTPSCTQTPQWREIEQM